MNSIIELPTIRGEILEYIIQYFYYKLQNQGSISTSVPPYNIDPSHSIELLEAAHFLNC